MMKERKEGFRDLLKHWLRWDGDLWAELRDIQIKILYQRIVKEMSFKEMAEFHKVPVIQIRMIFEAIMLKLERTHGENIVNLIREVDDEIECGGENRRPESGFDIQQIWLN